MTYSIFLDFSPLQTAIFNVILFLKMKEAFGHRVMVRYKEDGVYLEADSEEICFEAKQYLDSSVTSVKIGLLASKESKSTYQNLITKMQQYMRNPKNKAHKYPFVNIVHFEKLRKSCDFIRKARYEEPLNEWKRIYQKHPQFAILVVDDGSRFQQMKGKMLEFLHDQKIQSHHYSIDIIIFAYYVAFSTYKDSLRECYQMCMMDIEAKKTQKVSFCTYKHQPLDSYVFRVIKPHPSLSKLGLPIISHDQAMSVVPLLEFYHQELGRALSLKLKALKLQNQNYQLIVYRQSQQAKYQQLQKRAASLKNEINVQLKLAQHRVFQTSQICLIDCLLTPNSHRLYSVHRALIKGVQYLVHLYKNVPKQKPILLYLDQLRSYYCASLVRYYGMANPSAQQFWLVFDKAGPSLWSLLNSYMLLDDMQIVRIALQMLYLISFLTEHDDPRSLGILNLQQIYVPFQVVLPFQFTHSGTSETCLCGGNTAQKDIQKVGLYLKKLFQLAGIEPSNNLFKHYYTQMLQTKSQTINLNTTINTLQDLLQ